MEIQANSGIKVSICMISYNHGKFIRQAIESILSQRVDFPIELVIGDDCSTDDTAAICRELANVDRRIKLLPTERNLGVMPNFARTLAACSGTYVAVCEGDDYWLDVNKLAKQVKFLDDNPDFSGASHQSDVLINDRFDRKFKLSVKPVLQTMDLTRGRLFHTASVIFRRPVVDCFCAAPLVLSCDRLLNFCMAHFGKIHYSEESMCAYRLHGSGMSSNATVAQMKLDLNCVDYLKSLQPSFPKYTYISYVYATIGLCRLATPWETLKYMTLSFLYSFADFPRNLEFYGGHLFKALKRRIL